MRDSLPGARLSLPFPHRRRHGAATAAPARPAPAPCRRACHHHGLAGRSSSSSSSGARQALQQQQPLQPRRPGAAPPASAPSEPAVSQPLEGAGPRGLRHRLRARAGKGQMQLLRLQDFGWTAPGKKGTTAACSAKLVPAAHAAAHAFFVPPDVRAPPIIVIVKGASSQVPHVQHFVIHSYNFGLVAYPASAPPCASMIVVVADTFRRRFLPDPSRHSGIDIR